MVIAVSFAAFSPNFRCLEVRLAMSIAGIYIPDLSGPNPMQRRRTMILALAVVLAFAGSTAPRHVRAATQDHHPAASEQRQHSHDHAGVDHSQDHGMAVETHATADATHDHAGSAPLSDQGCCYAWCYSGALIHAAEWPVMSHAPNEHAAFERPFRIAVFSAGIDPPPR